MAMRRPSLLVSSLLFLVILRLFGVTALRAQTTPDFDSLAKSASAAREANRKDEAIEDYRRGVEVRPDWEEGWWYLGTLQYDANHFAEAVPALRKVVELDPSLGAAWNFLGLCEFETHDYQNSLLHLKRGAELGAGDDPELAKVSHYHLGLLLIRNREFEQAGKVLSSSAVDTGSPQIKSALGLVLLRIPLFPDEVDPSREALIRAAGEAASLLAHGDSAKAASSLQRLVKDYPGIPYLHFAFGNALSSAGRKQEALDQYHEELKLSPQSAVVHLQLAKIALTLQRGSEAVAAAKAAVQLAPDSSDAYRALGQSEQLLGHSERASEYLKKAGTLGSPEPQPESRVEKLYAANSEHGKGTNNPPAQPSGNFEALAQQASSYQAAGNSADAIRTYGEALRLRPDWDDGWWNLAMLNYGAGHYPEAISDLKPFLQRKPDNGTAWAVMGLSEFETKQYDSALIHLQRGQQLGFGGSPESVQLATYRLGLLFNRDSQFERAMEVLAPQAQTKSRQEEMEFALGMSLMRIPLLPEQVKGAQRALVQTAGQVAVLLQNSKYDEALPKLKSMIQQYPSVPFLHYAYGVALSSLSQYEDAAEQFRNEEPISPKSELPYLRLASIALRTSHPADAERFAARAIELAPNSAEAHYLSGRASLAQGKQIAAIGELETAARISPGSPEVHFNLAKAYGKANLPDKEERERAIFTRLNELAQQERGMRGSQSYGASRDTNDFHATSATPSAEPPQPE
jgi:tetratricopeptide (TPR) repeat protein